MKKLIKATVLILLLAFLIADISCSTRKSCRGMRFHNDDVRRGLAH